MALKNLSDALSSLRTEEDEIQGELAKLNRRLGLIKSSIESLSQLMADDEDVDAESSDDVGPLAFDATLPLKQHIYNVLKNGPLTAKRVSEVLLEGGYETKSQDFANVVGTALRGSLDVFKRTDDGRWSVHTIAR